MHTKPDATLFHYFVTICDFTTFLYSTTYLCPLVTQVYLRHVNLTSPKRVISFSVSLSSPIKFHYKVPMNWLRNSFMDTLATRDFTSTHSVHFYFNIKLGHCKSAMAPPSTTAKMFARWKHDATIYTSSTRQKYFVSLMKTKNIAI